MNDYYGSHGDGYEPRMPRFGPRRRFSGAVKTIIITCAAVFLLQLVSGGRLEWFFGLSRAGMSRLWLWQLVTYLFLHGGLMHLAFNMLGLYFFGSAMEEAVGTRRFLALFFACGILGGLGWLLLTRTPWPCIGASGAIFGIAGAFAAMFPRQRIVLLLFFVLPVTMTARTMAIVFAIISLFSMLDGGDNIAHAAHLAGGIAGYFWGKRMARRRGDGGGGQPQWEHPKRTRQRPWSFGSSRDEEREPTMEELNAVLERLQAKGFGGLSRRERRILEWASKKMRDQDR